MKLAIVSYKRGICSKAMILTQAAAVREQMLTIEKTRKGTLFAAESLLYEIFNNEM
ncbi:hypothetical protein [Paenibacillus sp. 1001270B_150601_E10]|uniref:hypothetical protein n=1 Tax=Paenibacillus sp. 1001270B_150601_E10 TaxID=2787079 RepID=UPI0018A112D8|nr:hypothetical protein [Paenibacillus sp. 1001270B_150601_E10]